MIPYDFFKYPWCVFIPPPLNINPPQLVHFLLFFPHVPCYLTSLEQLFPHGRFFPLYAQFSSLCVPVCTHAWKPEDTPFGTSTLTFDIGSSIGLELTNQDRLDGQCVSWIWLCLPLQFWENKRVSPHTRIFI